MFTGIIEKTGKIVSVKSKGKNLSMAVSLPIGWKCKLGDSVSVDGICSTIKSLNKKEFDVEYIPETLGLTTAKDFIKNKTVNLERSLKIGERLDGHFVYGHIDGMGKVTNIEDIKKAGEKDVSSKVIRIASTKEILKYIIHKGSVAVNGVSLTISQVQPASAKSFFEVSLIPFTLDHTNLGELSVGSKVNIETDILGKYIINTYAAKK